MEISAAIATANEKTWGRGVKLADSTMEWKSQQGLPEDPLVASGRLKASLTQPAAEGAIREITNHEMRFGSSIFYGRFQQYGTSKMPRHRVLKFGVGIRRLVKDLLHRHLMS